VAEVDGCWRRPRCLLRVHGQPPGLGSEIRLGTPRIWVVVLLEQDGAAHRGKSYSSGLYRRSKTVAVWMVRAGKEGQAEELALARTPVTREQYARFMAATETR
jgi:hypothetical protein